jgi:hypothetical protein
VKATSGPAEPQQGRGDKDYISGAMHHKPAPSSRPTKPSRTARRAGRSRAGRMWAARSERRLTGGTECAAWSERPCQSSSGCRSIAVMLGALPPDLPPLPSVVRDLARQAAAPVGREGCERQVYQGRRALPAAAQP